MRIVICETCSDWYTRDEPLPFQPEFVESEHWGHHVVGVKDVPDANEARDLFVRHMRIIRLKEAL